jgi:hypothetical protein
VYLEQDAVTKNRKREGDKSPSLFTFFVRCRLMNVQLLVCDEITNNPVKKGHRLGTVLNHVTIPVLPYAIDLHLLVKIFDLPKEEGVDVTIKIYNVKGEIRGGTGTLVVRNYRENDQIPGVDRDIRITLVVTEPEILYFRCYVNEEEAAWYPMTVRLEEDTSSEKAV